MVREREVVLGKSAKRMTIQIESDSSSERVFTSTTPRTISGTEPELMKHSPGQCAVFTALITNPKT